MALFNLDDVADAMRRSQFIDHKASGLSVREWCDRHGVPKQQFAP